MNSHGLRKCSLSKRDWQSRNVANPVEINVSKQEEKMEMRRKVTRSLIHDMPLNKEEPEMERKVTKELILDMRDVPDLVSVLKEYIDAHTGDLNETVLTIKRIHDFIIDNDGATELRISHNTEYSVS